MPNITTNHAITYTNNLIAHKQIYEIAFHNLPYLGFRHFTCANFNANEDNLFFLALLH